MAQRAHGGRKQDSLPILSKMQLTTPSIIALVDPRCRLNLSIFSLTGSDWDLSTDTFLAHETCCLLSGSPPMTSVAATNTTTSIAPSNSTSSVSTSQPTQQPCSSLSHNHSLNNAHMPATEQTVAQFYTLLQDVYKQHKFCRRGIHLHVQYRDVHEKSYHTWPYSEKYIASLAEGTPDDDLNVWGDGFNESLTAALPPRKPRVEQFPGCVPPSTQTPANNRKRCRSHSHKGRGGEGGQAKRRRQETGPIDLST